MVKMTMKVPEMSCKFPPLYASIACKGARLPSPRPRVAAIAHPAPYAVCNTARFGSPHSAAAAVTGGHCKGVIEKEVAKIEGVITVSADPTSKDVVVSPSLASVWAF